MSLNEKNEQIKQSKIFDKIVLLQKYHSYRYKNIFVLTGNVLDKFIFNSQILPHYIILPQIISMNKQFAFVLYLRANTLDFLGTIHWVENRDDTGIINRGITFLQGEPKYDKNESQKLFIEFIGKTINLPKNKNECFVFIDTIDKIAEGYYSKWIKEDMPPSQHGFPICLIIDKLSLFTDEVCEIISKFSRSAYARRSLIVILDPNGMTLPKIAKYNTEFLEVRIDLPTLEEKKYSLNYYEKFYPDVALDIINKDIMQSSHLNLYQIEDIFCHPLAEKSAFDILKIKKELTSRKMQ